MLLDEKEYCPITSFNFTVVEQLDEEPEPEPKDSTRRLNHEEREDSDDESTDEQDIINDQGESEEVEGKKTLTVSVKSSQTEADSLPIT